MSSDRRAKSDAPSVLQSKDVADTKSGYRPFFGLGEGKKDPLPLWLPISLLALTTAALAAPIVLLRRQRAATALQKSVGGAPPPRRIGSSGTPSSPPPRRSVSTSSAAPPPRIPSKSEAPPLRVPAKTGTTSLDRSAAPQIAIASSPAITDASDGFNGALYSAKAFGIATLCVGAGAVTMVWGVQQVLGVQNTQEFAHRMRSLILYRMPFLSSRIHRPPETEDSQEVSDALRMRVDQTPRATDWTWHDAERRLAAAYEERGIMGWAQAALQELEAEGELERSKRGHT